ncbi:MAG: NepR family anti-sigma factor [Xanthobacteraceae bacterium]
MNSRERSNDHRQSKRNKSVPLSKELQEHLGGKLRAAYGQLVQEPVPDRFTQLLKQLSDAEKKNPAAGDKEPNT